MMKQYSAVMRKRTNGRSMQNESENVGCISSIFRMFDFRQGPKLISYFNYTGKHAVVDVNAKSKTNGGIHACVDNVKKKTRARPGMQNVKMLMEEEMAKLIPASLIPRKSCQNENFGDKHQVKLAKRLNQEIEKPHRLMFPQSPESFDFTNQTDCYELDSCLSEFSSQEIYPKKKDKSNCNSSYSNPIILECLGGLDQSFCQNNPIDRGRKNYWERDKTRNQGYSRIVILKPSLSRINSPPEGIGSERGLHHFSLTEIKSKLRKTIIESRKERDLISVESDISRNASKADKNGGTKMDLIGDKEAKRAAESFSYEMAKMHLIQRVDNLGKNDLKIKRKRKSLSSLFSLPDFDSLSSPICTPRKEDDAALLAEDSNIKYTETFEVDYDAGSLNQLIGHKTTEDVFKETPEELDLHEDGHKTQSEERNTLSECSDLLEKLLAEKPESLQLSEKEDTSNSDNRSIYISVQSSVPEVTEPPGTLEEKTENSCPAPLHDDVVPEDNDEVVPEDNVRFTSRSAKQEELPIQQPVIRFKEFDISSFFNPTYEMPILDDKETQYEFVSVAVKASGLCRGDLERWRADDTLLDLFLYDEIGISYDYSNDSKYLFDLIEEVLNDIRDKFVVPSQWFWSINKRVQTVPVGEDLILEVCKGVDFYLNHKFPCTLDQIVGKDLEYRSWMDTRPDIEVIVVEIEDDMLDDLLEDAIFDLWFNL